MTKQQRARLQRQFVKGFVAWGNCASCGHVGKLVADHKIPVTMGGSWSPENRQGLCVRCHGRKTTREHRDPFSVLEEQT